MQMTVMRVIFVLSVITMWLVVMVGFVRRRRRRFLVVRVVISLCLSAVGIFSGLRLRFVVHTRLTDLPSLPYAFRARLSFRAAHAHARQCSRLHAPQKISSLLRKA